jgi:hypothetical protein
MSLVSTINKSSYIDHLKPPAGGFSLDIRYRSIAGVENNGYSIRCTEKRPMGSQTVTLNSSVSVIKKPLDLSRGFHILVGRARFELATNGLKVRCSTD